MGDKTLGLKGLYSTNHIGCRMPDFLFNKRKVWYQIIKGINENLSLKPTAFLELKKGKNIFFQRSFSGNTDIPVLNSDMPLSYIRELLRSGVIGEGVARENLRVYLRQGVIDYYLLTFSGEHQIIYVKDFLTGRIVGNSPFWLPRRVQPEIYSFQPFELLPVSNIPQKIKFLGTG